MAVVKPLMNDTILCFYFCIYHDDQYALRLAKQLNHYYPTSQKIAIYDGLGDKVIKGQLKDFNVTVHNGARFKRKGMGMLHIQRNLHVLLENSNPDTFINMDPDSFMWRKFNNLPNADWFGQIQNLKVGNFTATNRIQGTHGACYGCSKTLAEALYSSKIFLDKKTFSHPGLMYRRYGNKFKKHGDKYHSNEWIPREDPSFAYAAQQLGYSPVKWENDLFLTQTKEQYSFDRAKAVTHPVRKLDDPHLT